MVSKLIFSKNNFVRKINGFKIRKSYPLVKNGSPHLVTSIINKLLCRCTFFGFQIHIFVYPSNTHIHRVITLPWQKDTGNERFRPRSPRGSNLSFQLQKTKKLWHSKKSREKLSFFRIFSSPCADLALAGEVPYRRCYVPNPYTNSVQGSIPCTDSTLRSISA